jgi:hypothetical protein
MRVIAHRPTHNVCNLVKFAVIHLKQGVDDAPLYRLESIDKVGYGPLLNDIAGIFKKVLFEN